MSTQCKCLNPEKGGTKCPEQHLALCIRGKDRECYGECIPIPSDYKKVSERFTAWSEIAIKERVIQHMVDFKEEYRAFESPERLSESLKTTSDLDFSNLSGILEYRTLNFDEIKVNFKFSFSQDLDNDIKSDVILDY